MKKKWVVILLCIVILSSLFLLFFMIDKNNKELKLIQDISSRYNDYVIVNKEAKLYQLKNNRYVSVGSISKDIELKLNKIDKITNENIYYMINDFGNKYYINYKDVDKIEKLSLKTDRYKNYILFNKSIVTKSVTNFYDELGNLIFTINASFNLPILINDSNMYGVLYEEKLLYIKPGDVKEIVEAKNTELKNTEGIAVLNYHFVYKPNVDKCNQRICHSTSQFESHMGYIKDNNLFTPTMKELEMYIDNKLNLPKSVVVTLDDGWLKANAVEIVDKFKVNATYFLITEYDLPIESEYMEFHSHTNNMHTKGDCPKWKGGGIQCLPEETILKDLKSSREKLNNTTVFCYPFYEYNNYSIEMLKKSGFTMAFAEKDAGGIPKAAPGIDKFRIPRYPMTNKTTIDYLKSII